MKELDLNGYGEHPPIDPLPPRDDLSPLKKILMGAGIYGETLNVVSAKIEAEFVRRVSESLRSTQILEK